MGKPVGMEVSIAISHSVRLANVDVIAAYPITPQTHIVEHLAELVANGELEAEYIPVESEHSALSSCIGSSAAGARTFTATSSQGLALMHEIVFIAPALRLPIVMVVANRALSGPISIWNDHSDIMAERDCGWIQTFAENGQEAIDLTLHAFRVAEDHKVLLPFIVNIDGFTLSHVTEPVEIPEPGQVARFLPDYEPLIRLDPEHPVTMGPVGIPEVYTEARKAMDETLQQSKTIVLKAWREFSDIFGRGYKPVETYRTEGAETILVTMGAISETAMTTIDRLREEGRKVGLVRIRLWRPFPFEEIRAALSPARVVAVVDRAMSLGGQGGPVCGEIRSALYEIKTPRPHVFGYIAGLGGRDVTIETFTEIIDKAETAASEAPRHEYEMIGVREI
ncbi:MAG: transketolase C-terminal domain-containing protein [Pseudomonadota bacterium]